MSAKNQGQGIRCEGDYNGCYVTHIHTGDYIKVRGVDFGDAGASQLTVRVRAENVAQMMVRIDSKSGSLKGKVSVGQTNGEWQELTCNLSTPIAGVHDLFFTFKANDDSKLDFDSWQFSDVQTSIEEITNNNKKSKSVYDLSGRRVDGKSRSKTIKIVNGKKLLTP